MFFLKGNLQDDILHVDFFHTAAFDEKNGLGRSEEELIEEGYLLESIPQPENHPNMSWVMKYNVSTQEVFYEYMENEKTLEEKVLLLQKEMNSASSAYNELDKSSTPLESLRTLRINKLKEECTLSIYEGFTSQAHEFGFNDFDQANFTQQHLLIVDGETADVNWKTKDAGVQAFTVDEFRAIITDAKAHKIANQVNYWQKEALVLAAETNESVDAVSWN
jgi:hypothetical protein